MLREFRKKPVVIQACQVEKAPRFEPYGKCLERIANWEYLESLSAETISAIGNMTPKGFDCIGMQIKTLEGTMTAMPGDWIIKGANSEFYPIKPDIFEETYDPVDSGETGREVGK